MSKPINVLRERIKERARDFVFAFCKGEDGSSYQKGCETTLESILSEIGEMFYKAGWDNGKSASIGAVHFTLSKFWPHNLNTEKAIQNIKYKSLDNDKDNQCSSSR